ncbi:hypothetical protein [Manganibacter manganicus]|nr:hypothetical protein [Pseudaminobacter manganicus]
MNMAAIHDGSASLRLGCWVVLAAVLSVVFSFALLREQARRSWEIL